MSGAPSPTPIHEIAASLGSRSNLVKYESPYAAPPPPEESRKRIYSDLVSNSDHSNEKRQRIEVARSPSNDADFDALLARAAESATSAQVVNPSNSGHAQASNGNQHGSNYPSNNGYLSDPQVYMRKNSAPILENLSSQILSLMLHGTYEETVEMFTFPQSDRGQRYQPLRSLLDQTKKMYISTGQKSTFLQADKELANDEEYLNTIWSTNFAFLVAAIFGGNESDWATVQDKFLEILVPKVEDLNQGACLLYLTFGTQMIMSSFSAEEQHQDREDTLDDFLPSDLDERLRGRHPGQDLTAVENDLVRNSAERRKMLEERGTELESLAKLMQEFSWDDFLMSFFQYIKDKHSGKIQEHKIIPSPSATRTAASNINSYPGPDLGFNIDAILTSATDSALQAAGSPNDMQASLYGEQYASGTPAAPSQSKPTAKLYEEARQQAASKNSSNNRRGTTGLSARRPWSNEEENALMAGLDFVKGPHWSQILQLYGASGAISHVLEHRNQVQLKDKARNLKLFFLKSGIEVPYYLSSVTGELKTRAPSQAARKEAEDQERLKNSEEVSRMNGILTLANGLQHAMSNHGLPVSNHGLPMSRSISQEEMHIVEPSKAEVDPNQRSLEDQMVAKLQDV